MRHKIEKKEIGHIFPLPAYKSTDQQYKISNVKPTPPKDKAKPSPRNFFKKHKKAKITP